MSNFHATNCGTWKVISSPNPLNSENFLMGVAAISTNDVWAVGYSYGNGYAYPLTEHWNGTSWNVVSSPSPTSNSYLNAVTAISTSDIWAVGYSISDGSIHTLTEHWDGTSWSVVSSPNTLNPENILMGVANIPGSNRVWSVGRLQKIHGRVKSLTEHWNGTDWRIVSSSNPGSKNYPLAVAANSANSVWAVGNYDSTSSGVQVLTEQWNGTSWRFISSPVIGTDPSLNGVNFVPGTNTVWAVGAYYDENTSSVQTLTEFYC